MAMAAAAAAAQVGMRLLSADVSVSQGSCINGGAGECRSSVSFASRRSSVSGGPFSLSHRSRGRGSSSSSSGSNLVRVVSAEKTVETVEAASTTASSEKTQYHYLIANAKFMLDEEEHFQELMRERIRHFGELNREQDFWLVIEPKFLAKFPEVEKRLGRPAVALVSTDSTWITFMKLRLDRVLKGVYEADSLTEALAGGNSSTEIKFEKPKTWSAPYPKYEGSWWTPFLPPQ